MPPADQSWATPITGVQALQLTNEHPTESSIRVDGSDPDGRKRRRITSLMSVPVPSSNVVVLEDAESGHGLDAPASPAPGTWDYLAKWEAKDLTVIEDLEEDEYLSDVSDDTPGVLEDSGIESEEEEDLPPQDPTTRPSRLGEELVTAVINECIEVYANTWKPGKGETKRKNEEEDIEAPVLYDTLALWEEAEAAGRREELTEKYRMEAEYYAHRLDILCEEISKDPGDTVAGIKRKCRNLEVTVELLERANWLISIYELSPDDSSDDEAQDKNSVNIGPARTPATQRPTYTPQRNSLSQVIDLATPSDTSASEDDGVSFSNIPIPPARISIDSKREQSSQDRLSTSDPAIDTMETPGPPVITSTPKTVRSRVPLGDAPEYTSIATVSRWSWSQLIDTQDRKRIVSKAIHDLSSADRETMRHRLQKVGRANISREIPACVSMLLRGDKRLPGILPQDMPKIVTFTKVFLCWWLCGNYLVEDPSEERLEELAGCLRQELPDPSTFCDYVNTVLSTTFSLEALSKPMQLSHAEVIEISDDDEPTTQLLKRRKSNVDKPGSLRKSLTIIID